MAIELPDKLAPYDKECLDALFQLLGTNDPRLEEIWLCMDFIWDVLKCDNRNINQLRINKFYKHPVWLLNGLFIEQDKESLMNREIFSDWVASMKPKRIADFGGGYGTLARMIATKCPDTRVEVIEPHTNQYSLELSKDMLNIAFKTRLEDEYDIIIATDIFEHIVDPLTELEKTSIHLRVGGKYLIANCFYPVIKCHLPCTFHYRYTWTFLLKKMNFRASEIIAYGRVFEKMGTVSVSNVRYWDRLFQIVSPVFILFTQYLKKLYRLIYSFINKLRDT